MGTLNSLNLSSAEQQVKFKELERADGQEYQAQLTLEIKSDVDGFASLHDEWDDLVDRSSTSIFQTFDWLFSWWIHFGDGPGRRLYILVFRSKGVLVGIAPLFTQLVQWRKGTICRKLKTMGGGVANDQSSYEHYAYYSPSDMMDILAARQYEAVVGKAVADQLNTNSHLFDAVDFANVPGEGLLFKRVMPFIDPNLLRCAVQRGDECPRLSVPISLEKFLSSLKPGVRRRLNQAWRSFSGESIARIETIHSKGEMTVALQQLIEMHQHRWNALGYPGMFSDKRFLTFQQEFTSRLFDKELLWCKRAQYAGVVIGCRIGYMLHGRVYDYLGGFDPASPGASRRPGLALLLSMIDDAVRDGMESVEFLRGDEHYKMELTSDSTYVWNITMESRNFERSFDARLALGLNRWNTIRHKFLKELFLMKIQLGRRGPILFLPAYLSFFIHRLSGKKQRFLLTLQGLFNRLSGVFRNSRGKQS